LGHDPQPRVGQASDQAITVNDRVDVAHHAARTDSGKGTLTGPSDSRVTHHAADNAKPAVTTSRPAATTLTDGSGSRRSFPRAAHRCTHRREIRTAMANAGNGHIPLYAELHACTAPRSWNCSATQTPEDSRHQLHSASAELLTSTRWRPNAQQEVRNGSAGCYLEQKERS